MTAEFRSEVEAALLSMNDDASNWTSDGAARVDRVRSLVPEASAAMVTREVLSSFSALSVRPSLRTGWVDGGDRPSVDAGLDDVGEPAPASPLDAARSELDACEARYFAACRAADEAVRVRDEAQKAHAAARDRFNAMKTPHNEAKAMQDWLDAQRAARAKRVQGVGVFAGVARRPELTPFEASRLTPAAKGATKG